MSKRVPPGMPEGEAKGRDREDLALWMKQHVKTMEREHQARIKLLREGGEHPTPIAAAMVRRFATLGLAKAQVARLIGCGVSALNQHYENEYELGVAEINLKVAANVARIATGDDPQAGGLGFRWLERRGGEEWKPPTQKLDVTQRNDEDGPRIIDSSRFTFEQREQLRQMLLAATDPPPPAVAEAPPAAAPVDGAHEIKESTAG